MLCDVVGVFDMMRCNVMTNLLCNVKQNKCGCSHVVVFVFFYVVFANCHEFNCDIL